MFHRFWPSLRFHWLWVSRKVNKIRHDTDICIAMRFLSNFACEMFTLLGRWWKLPRSFIGRHCWFTIWIKCVCFCVFVCRMCSTYALCIFYFLLPRIGFHKENRTPILVNFIWFYNMTGTETVVEHRLQHLLCCYDYYYLYDTFDYIAFMHPWPCL